MTVLKTLTSKPINAKSQSVDTSTEIPIRLSVLPSEPVLYNIAVDRGFDRR